MSSRTLRGLVLAALASGLALAWGGAARGGEGPGAVVRKVVTEKSSFVLCLPPGWTAREAVVDGGRAVSMSDAAGRCETAMRCGTSPAGDDILKLIMHQLGHLAGLEYDDIMDMDEWVRTNRRCKGIAGIGD